MAANSSTSRPLIAGDVIIDTKPLVHIVYNELKDKYCDNCVQLSTSLKKCSNCHQMSYCDKNCQKNDWKYHKNECKVLKSNEFNPNQIKWSERLLIRLWLTIKSDQTFATKRHQLFYGSDVCLNDIGVKEEDLLKDSDRMIDFQQICRHFEVYRIEFNRKELLHWFGVITTSAIRQEFISYSSYMGGPLDPRRIPVVGMGLYLELSRVSHSCFPNSVIVFNGLSLQLRANKSIDIGTQITTSYVYLAQNKAKRHNILRLKYFIFGCNCVKCEQNVDSDMDCKKLEKLFDKQTQQINKSFDTNIETQFVSEIGEISALSRRALGQFNPKLTEILINEIMFRQSLGLCIQGEVGQDYYQRLEEHILITYGVNHPIYIQTHKPNPHFRLVSK